MVSPRKESAVHDGDGPAPRSRRQGVRGHARPRHLVNRTALISRWTSGVLAALALLWPARLVAPLDGVPLDGSFEAILLGLVFPALWWYFPRFLDKRTAKGLIVALLAWKALLASAAAEDGWCIRFNPKPPIAKDAPGAPHSWDLRADWRTPDPSCSAIVARQYEGLGDFPAWFFNLPPASESWPAPRDRPPGAITPATITGYLQARAPGTLSIEIGDDMDATLAVDGREAARSHGGRLVASVGSGVHAVNVAARLAGESWRLVAEWNGRDLWSQSAATVRRPSSADRLLRPWGRWIAPLAAIAILGWWFVYALRTFADADALTWSIAAGCWFGFLAWTGHEQVVRWSIPLLAGAAFLPVRRRSRDATGMFVLVGVPWLAMIAGLWFEQIGRWRLYEVGSDFWTFQRAAYRIVMLGYWLEGGSPTFWFQPLYRWIAGLLHAVFGDSSVGEMYWDAACIAAGASFAYAIARRAYGHRWGVLSAVLVFAMFALGNPWQNVGRGLSEISSAGFLSLAALAAMRARRGRWSAALGAGGLAALAFYTRLNNLPMAFAIALFALPPTVPASALWRPQTWIRRVSWPSAIAVIVTLVVAMLLFAWRTWYYTGVFSVTYGTQAHLLAVWKPGMRTGEVLRAMAGSVMMVLTMNDPPRLDVFGAPLVAATTAGVLAIAGVPRLRRLPLAPILFCLSGLAGALVARGSAYEGRFSVHIIPVSAALAVCMVAALGGVRTSGVPRCAVSPEAESLSPREPPIR